MAVFANNLFLLSSSRLKTALLQTVREDKEPVVSVKIEPLTNGIWSVVATVFPFRVRVLKLVGKEFSLEFSLKLV